METKRICPECRRTLADDAPQGLCPQCLVKAGLGSGVNIGAETKSGQPRNGSPAGWRVLFPLYAVLGLIFGTVKSAGIQGMIMKPGHRIGEIQPFLRLLAFICGLLAIIFSVIVLINKGRFPGE